MGDAYITVSDPPEFDVDVSVIEPEVLKTHIGEGEALTIFGNHVPSEHGDQRIDGKNASHVSIPYFEFLDEKLDESLFEELPEDEEFIVLHAKDHSSGYVAGPLIQEDYDVMALEHDMNGWVSIYEYTEPGTDGDVPVARYQRPSSGYLTYLVVDDDEIVVVDPPRYFANEYAADAKALGAELTYAINTYIRADHTSGIRTLVENHGVVGVIPEATEARGVDYDTLYETIADGETFTVDGTGIEAIRTPGHMIGVTTCAVDNVLFTGDDLSVEPVTCPDLEDSDEDASGAAGMLYGLLQKRALSHDDDAIVASAHFSNAAIPADNDSYTATLGELKGAMNTLSIPGDGFVEFTLSDMPPRSTNYVDIAETSLGVQESDDSRAFKLELGPNNCTASNEALTN